MAIEPTRYSRVSIGWITSTQSIVDKDAGDTGTAMSWDGGAAGDSLTLTGAISVTGATRIGAGTAPASSTSAGTVGDLAFDGDYLYLYTSNSSWVVLSAFSLF